MSENLVYSQEQLKRLHEKVLSMAEFFVDFCNKNGLTCYFCGGGCIGTIRHGGFIPWDDDLDFFMPRNDYEKLKKVWNQSHGKGQYVLRYPTKHYNDHNSFMTLRDVNTTQIKPYQKDMDIVHGITIDIFPLDGCPSGGFKRKMQLMHAMVYSLYCSNVIPVKHGKFMRIIATVMLKCVPGQKLKYYIWKYAEKQMSKYPIDKCEKITELCAGPGPMRFEYPKECFDSAVFRKFENTMMPIPVGYDGYLKIAFGDYMKLPPADKQVAHHDCVFMDLENSYKKYKGIYYLIDNKK